VDIFQFEDYRACLSALIDGDNILEPGARKRLLHSLRISSSLLTQILAKKRQLSMAQAFAAAEHFSLTEAEIDYFLLLIEIEKSGSARLEARLKKKLRQLKLNSQKLATKVAPNVSLTEEQKIVYYSNWLYTAIRNLVSTRHVKSSKEIAAKLQIPVRQIETPLQFLIEHGLINKSGPELSYLPGSTHLESNHPMIFRHHQNWRQRAVERMDHYTEDHLHYSCPMGISKEAAQIIRARLVSEIKNLHILLRQEPEVAFCLNIDFFEY